MAKTALRSERESGIELLRLLAIFLIVLNHTVQTLHGNDVLYPYLIKYATTEPTNLVLVLFRYGGMLGNDIFFLCSAWFFCQSRANKKKKLANMLAEVWIVSVLIAAVSFVVLHGELSAKEIVYSLLPTTFSCTWYTTCYMIFYAMYPVLNRLIAHLPRKVHLRCTLALFALYLFLTNLRANLFFGTNLMTWIAIYFLVAYIRQYHADFADSKKANLLLLLGGLLAQLFLLGLTNFVGLQISAFSGQLFFWIKNCNPLPLAVAFALFNLFRRLHFKSRVVNGLASLSLLIYIIHENTILGTKVRPLLWDAVYRHFGYAHLVLWALILAVVVFLASTLLALVYRLVLQKPVERVSGFLYEKLRALYLRLEEKLLRK